jgi:DNA-binding NarL/FixJ family response regulator
MRSPASDSDLPDVILTDIGLPGMSGVEGIRILRERHAQIPVVALTVYDDDREVFAALCAGASGLPAQEYSLLPASWSPCVRSSRAERPCPPRWRGAVIRLFRQFRPPELASYHLTPQETELLRLLVEGHHYKTAADKLASPSHTVSFSPAQISIRSSNVLSKTGGSGKACCRRGVGLASF